MSKIGILLLTIALMTGCAQMKPIGSDAPSAPDPAQRSEAAPVTRSSESPPADPPKRDWKSALAVPPGTSLEEGKEQVIRFLSKKEFREFEGRFWIAGKGFALTNSGGGAYFWGKPTPPQLEVEVSDGSRAVYDACKKIVQSGFRNGQMLFLEGEGFFERMERPQGSLGVFKLSKVSKCRLGSPKDYNKISR